MRKEGACDPMPIIGCRVVELKPWWRDEIVLERPHIFHSTVIQATTVPVGVGGSYETSGLISLLINVRHDRRFSHL